MLPSGMSVWWICTLEPASPRLPGKDWENRTVFAIASWYQKEDINLDMSQLLSIKRERNRETGNGGRWGLGNLMPWDLAEQRWHWKGSKWALTSPGQPRGSEGRGYRWLAGLQLPDPMQWGGPAHGRGTGDPSTSMPGSSGVHTPSPHLPPTPLTKHPHRVAGAEAVEAGASGLNWIPECLCVVETTPSHQLDFYSCEVHSDYLKPLN